MWVTWAIAFVLSQQPQALPPWEQRLLALEARVDEMQGWAKQAKTEGQRAIDSSKFTTSNHRQRLELLEEWKREHQTSVASEDGPVARAEAAASRAAEADDKASRLSDRTDEIDKQIKNWIVALGGSGSLGVGSLGAVVYYLRKLHKKIAINGAASDPSPDDETTHRLATAPGKRAS